jgi:hypothetical protein
MVLLFDMINIKLKEYKMLTIWWFSSTFHKVTHHKTLSDTPHTDLAVQLIIPLLLKVDMSNPLYCSFMYFFVVCMKGALKINSLY